MTITASPLVTERLPLQTHARSQRLWRWPSKDALLMVVLVAFAGLVHGWNMYQSPSTSATDDEGTYVAQAWAILHQGALAHYTYWYDHPPNGWVTIALWAWLTDAFDRLPASILVGREVMLIAKLATAGLLYGLARRLQFNRLTASLAVVLLAVNPLALYFQRLTLLDNIAVPWMLAAFFLATSPQKRLAAHAGSGLCFAMAVLNKETLALLLPALLYLLWQNSDRRTRAYSFSLFLSLFAGIVILYPLGALLKGELLPGPGHVSLWDAIKWQLVDRVPSGSLFDPTSVAAETARGWMSLDIWLLVIAGFALPITLMVRRLRPVALALLIQVVMLFRGKGYLPFPYIIAMLPFAALLIAGLLDVLWRAPGTIGARLAGRPVLSWIPAAASRAPQAVALGLMLAFAVTVALPRWTPKLETMLTAPQNAAIFEATEWIGRNVPRDRVVLVGDAIWVDLVERGFPPEKVIWYYKPNTDPEVSASLPNNWQDIGYLATDVEMRELISRLRGTAGSGIIQTTIDAYDRSTPVAKFGPPGDEIVISRVSRP